MALHPVKKQCSTLTDDTYACALFKQAAEKHKFPAKGTTPREAYELVHDELMLDGNARMNLATFCTTWCEPEVRRLMSKSLEGEITE